MDVLIEHFRNTYTRPSGWFLPILRTDHAVVWLIGDIDVAVSSDLADLTQHLLAAGKRELFIEACRVQFCDATLASFLKSVIPLGPVTVRRPPRLVRDHLRIFGLYDAVTIHETD